MDASRDTTDPARTESDQPFESLNLAVGTRLQLIVGSGAQQRPFFTSLIGYVANHCIMVHPLLVNGVPVTLHDGEQVGVRVFCGRAVFHFTAAILYVTRAPIACVYVSYPDRMQRTTVRSAVRVQVDVPVHILPSRAPAEPVSGRMHDLSLAGARVSAAQSVGDKGEAITVRFALGPEDRASDPFEVQGDIRAISTNELGGASAAASRFMHGIQFANLTLQQQFAIQSFLYDAITLDRRRVM